MFVVVCNVGWEGEVDGLLLKVKRVGSNNEEMHSLDIVYTSGMP